MNAPSCLPADASLYVFDFCGTLFRANTTLAFIAHLARPSGPVSWQRNLASRLPAAAGRRLGVLPPTGHMRMRVRALRGIPRGVLADEARRFVAGPLAARANPAAMALLAQAEARSVPVVIASYSLDEIVSAFAAGRRIARTFASTLAYDAAQRCAGRYARQLQGQGKVAILRDAFGDAAVRGAYFLTDDPVADRDLLDAVRYPVVLAEDACRD